MKKVILIIVAILIVVINISLYLDPVKADYIFKGQLYGHNLNDADTIAVKDHQIIFVGRYEQASSLIGEKTKTIKLKKNQILTPGFHDSHAHFASIGMKKSHLDVSEVKNEQEFLEKINQRLQTKSQGEWLFVQGWHQDKIKPSTLIAGYPTNDLLSAISPNHPVVVYHSSFHMALLNQKAVKMLGLTAKDLSNKNIIKNSNHLPTGIFLESAMGLISKMTTKLSYKEYAEIFDLAQEEAWENGITSIHDAGINQDEYESLKKFEKEMNLNLRLFLLIDSREENFLQAWLERGAEILPLTHLVQVRGIKYFADGALGSRTAFLSHPYHDSVKTYGDNLIDEEKLRFILDKAFKKDLMVGVHAIGDQANHLVLNLFAEFPHTKSNLKRIEHAQHLKTNDIERFFKQGVIASMQGVHYDSDKSWAKDRIGQKNLEDGGYAWRKIIDHGGVLISGSDAPVEPLNPMLSMSAYVSRDKYSLTIQEAFLSFTKNPSQTLNVALGELKTGYFADLVIWNRDFFKEDIEQIKTAKAIFTMVNGQVVFDRR